MFLALPPAVLLGVFLAVLSASQPATLAYLRFCSKLGRKGLPREECPSAYAARLSCLRPELAPRISTITRLYVALRYGAGASAAEVRELEQQVKRFSA
jgi:hypothetical protein